MSHQDQIIVIGYASMKNLVRSRIKQHLANLCLVHFLLNCLHEEQAQRPSN